MTLKQYLVKEIHNNFRIIIFQFTINKSKQRSQLEEILFEILTSRFFCKYLR